MGKNKYKKTWGKKGVKDAILETSPVCSITYKKPTKTASQRNKDSCIFDPSQRLETVTCSSEKVRKKRKQIHLHTQGPENGCSELLGETHKKRKKKEKLGHQEENASKKNVKKSSRNVGIVEIMDSHDEDVTLELEESEPKSKEKSKDQQKREKRKKLKNKSSVSDKGIMSFATSDQDTLTTQTDFVQTLLLEESDEEELTSPTIQTGTGILAKRHKRGGALEIDPKLLEELQEFVPNVDSKEPSDIIKMINYDLPRYKDFKKMGISINHGRFSVKENEMLKKNVEDFLALTGIDSAIKLFFPFRYKEERKRITTLKKVHQFFVRIAEGIPRSCHDVYARGRRCFDGSNYKGQFSESEIIALCKLRTLHGNNWRKISELTGRSPSSLEKRYAQLSSIMEGVWSEKEVRRLLRAVRDHIVSDLEPGCAINSVRVNRETLYKKLPWMKIAAKVKTRCWTKCREKWMAILAVKMSCGTVQMKEKSLEMKIKLIKALYEMQVDDVVDVNWDDMTGLIGDVPPAYVQRKWHKLKVCHVPNWQSKCFADIIDFLYDHVLPDFEKELKLFIDLNETQEDQQETFLLSHIFQDIEDDCTDSNKAV